MDALDLHSCTDSSASEADRIVAWRRSRLLALGYSEAAAKRIATALVDIHQVERLIDHGCPLDLAIEIAR